MERVRVERGEGLARLVLANPPVNVIDRAVIGEMRRGLRELAGEAALRLLVVEGEGKHFSAGADVGEHLPPDHEGLLREFRALLDELGAFPAPTLAAVRGRCLGGGFEVVQRCDLVVAEEGAAFGQPEIRLGVPAPFASAYLPRVLPRASAMALLLTGATITAAEAHRLGLVSRVVPDGELEGAVRGFAEALTPLSAAALRLAKRSALEGAEGSPAAGVDAALEVYLGPVMATRDALEGLRAFLEKRPPRWVHG